MGVSGQNAIWMWASWRGTKYTRRRKVVASPKSGSCWVLWVRICLWFVLAPKVFQLCTKHLVFGFVQVCVSSWCLSFFLIPSRNSSTPLYPFKVLQAKECAPTPYSSIIFSLNSHLSPLRSLGACHRQCWSTLGKIHKGDNSLLVHWNFPFITCHGGREVSTFSMLPYPFQLWLHNRFKVLFSLGLWGHNSPSFNTTSDAKLFSS